MYKNLKKLIAVVVVLAMAVSLFAINSSAAAEQKRVVDAISTVVDGVATSDDVEEKVGVDVSTLIDVVKDVAKAEVNTDELSATVSDIVPIEGDNIEEVVEEAADAVVSSTDNSDAIDESDLKDVVGGFGSSDLGSDALGQIVKATAESLDIPASQAEKATEVLKLLIATVKGGDIKTATPVSVDGGKWIGTWSTSMVEGSVSLSSNAIKVSLLDVTARTRLLSSRKGDVIRITLSNLYGKADLNVGEITLALANETVDRGVQPDSLVKLTVGGNESFTIPAGQTVQTDPIEFHVEACQELMISTYYKGVNEFSTIGLIGGHCYVGIGNQTEQYVSPVDVDLAAENLSVGAYEILPVISNVDVYDTDPNAYSVVVFGDSTTTNTTVPKLASMLKQNGIENIGLLLQGIKGNEVLHDGMGTIGSIMGKSALARFENDVIKQPGVKKVLIKVGLNDVLHPACASKSEEYAAVYGGTLPTNEEMIALIENGYNQMIDAAKSAGLEVYFATRTPGRGYTRNLLGITGDDISDEAYMTKGEPVRLALNDWLRAAATNGVINGLVDLEFMMDPDPERTGALRPDYTIDGAHLTDLGCQQFAKAAYPVLFGTSREDIDFSGTESYGGIEKDLKPIIQLVQKLFDSNNSRGDLDLSKLAELIALIKNGTGDSEGDASTSKIEDLINKINPGEKPSTDIVKLITDLIKNAGSDGDAEGNKDVDLSTLIKILGGMGVKDVDIDALKDLLANIRGEAGTPGTDDSNSDSTSETTKPESKIDFTALLGLLNKIKNGSGDTDMSLDGLKDLVNKVNPDNTVDTDILAKIMEVINSKKGTDDETRVDGDEISRGDETTGSTESKLDLETLKALLGGLGLPEVDDSTITGLLDKINNGGTITLPEIVKGDELQSWIEGILGGKDNDATDDSTSTDTKVEDKDPQVTTDPVADADPAVDPATEETLQDVEVINGVVMDGDETPLASVTDDTATASLLDSAVIANTGDTEMVAGAALTLLVAAAACVTTHKKKED